MDCLLCTNVIEEQQPKTSLMCGHTFHTRCMLIDILHVDQLEDYSCVDCNQNIISHEILLEAFPNENPNHNQQNQQEEHQSPSEEFNNGIKNILENFTTFKSKRSKLNKKIKEIHNEYKTFIKPQISIIKNYIQSKKQIIKKFEEYKEDSKARSKLKRSEQHFCRTYNMTEYILMNYIEKYHKIDIRLSYFDDIHRFLTSKFRISIQ